MSYILWLLLATFVSYLAFHAIQKVLKAKYREQAHEQLLKQVKRYRFHKMLKFLGADPDEYLDTVPIEDIDQQIERCSLCSSPDYCDRCLRDGKQVKNMDFCPNHPSISKHSKTIHQSRLQHTGRSK